MRAALRICREHGQPPSWWSGMTRGDRTLLLADQRMRDADNRRAAERAKQAAQRNRGR